MSKKPCKSEEAPVTQDGLQEPTSRLTARTGVGQGVGVPRKVIEPSAASEPEVLPPTMEPGVRLMKTKQGVRDALKKVDEQRAKAGKPIGLAETWDELQQFFDTNEMIRLNLTQNQVHIQETQRRYYEYVERAEKRLNDLLDETEDFDKWQEEDKRLTTEKERRGKHVSDLMRLSTQLAKEYRSCALQQVYTVNISKVKQFQTIVEGAIHRNVHDEETLKAIQSDISDAMQAIFPVKA